MVSMDYLPEGDVAFGISNRIALPTCTPEDAGIPSSAFNDLIWETQDRGVQLHSLMVLRHGKVAAQLWWRPYSPEMPHHLYSASKSFTSTAIGFAISEGLLSLDDRIAKFFPRRIGENADPRIYSVSVEHLLTMTSGAVLVNEATMGAHVDWVDWFLNTPLMHFPGDKFVYNSLNTYILSAIIRRVAGCGLVDYLMPRLFEPLGIERPEWAVCPMGIECGGWGLDLRTEDLARFGQMYLDGGMWQGKRILPQEWVNTAGRKHVESTTDDKMPVHPDRIAGYGYQFWRNRDGISFRADGMMGQYVLIMPDKDMVIVVTAGCTEQMEVLDLLWDVVISRVDTIPQGSMTGADYKKLAFKAEKLDLYLPKNIERDNTVREFERAISGREYLFHVNTFSMLPLVIRYLDNLTPLGIDWLRLDFGDTISTLSWREDGCDNRIAFTMDDRYTFGKVTYGDKCMPVSANAGWLTADTLEVDIRVLRTPHMLRGRFRFSQDSVFFSFDEDPSLEDTLKTAFNMIKLVRPMSSQLAKIASRIVPELEGTAK